MANTVSNIAVISFPRSGSKTLVKNISKELNKQPALGVLHTPEHLGENNYNVKEIVFSHEYVLHGHWHTINDLEDDVKEEIKNNYKIIDIIRKPVDVIQSLSELIDKDKQEILDIYFETLYKTFKAKKDWKIHETIIFEEYFI